MSCVPCECERATCDACEGSIDVAGLLRQIDNWKAKFEAAREAFIDELREQYPDDSKVDFKREVDTAIKAKLSAKAEDKGGRHFHDDGCYVGQCPFAKAEREGEGR